MEQFESLRQQEQQYFLDMVQQCKDSGATLVICQWGEAGCWVRQGFCGCCVSLARRTHRGCTQCN